MSIFDLLFILLFLTSVVTLLIAASLALRGRGSRALAVLRNYAICAAAYMAVVIVSSAFWPRTILQIGERRCFDDWCIAVESATPSYLVTLRISSTARGISQSEKNVVVYLTDPSGHRYDPVPDDAAVPIAVRLGPGDSVAATRRFNVPAGIRVAGLIIDHEGGFPIGCFIIGDETWFHKPTLVRLTPSATSRPTTP